MPNYFMKTIYFLRLYRNYSALQFFRHYSSNAEFGII